MLLTGRPIDCDSLERLGFVNRVTPQGEVLNAALEPAKSIVANAPRQSKTCSKSPTSPVPHQDEEDWQRSDGAHRRVILSKDFREGVEAFFAAESPSGAR